MTDGAQILERMFGGSEPAPAAAADPEPATSETDTTTDTGETGTEGETPEAKGAEVGEQDAKGAEPDEPASASASPEDGEEPDDTEGMTPAEKGKHEALLAERRQRQTAEAEVKAANERVAALEARLTALEQTATPQQQAAKTETPVDFWGNPLERTAEQTRQILVEHDRMRTWRSTSAEARKTHGDFDAVAQQFQAEMATNPYLEGWWYQQDNPAEALYDYMTRIKPALANGTVAPARTADPVAGTGANQPESEDALRARIRAEVEQEQAQKNATASARATPTSQARARGSGASPGRTVSSPEQLLGRMFSGRA